MYGITNSVGRHGVNIGSDVRIVQALLNRQIVPSSRLLRIDDVAGSRTIAAILAFQHRLGLAKCDGLVTPAGRTFSALCSLPNSVPITERCLDAFSGAAKMLGASITAIGSHVDPSIDSAASFLKSHRHFFPALHLPISPPSAIAWGAKVSPEFKKRVIEICAELEMNPDYLMSCMAFETGETFRADIPNKAGSGAIGLIQFMPATANGLNTTTKELSEMTTVAQLEYVRKYFLPYKHKLKTIEDTYMVILWPIAIGKDKDTVIFISGTKRYNQNKGFDRYPHNGEITPRECTAAITQPYKKGLSRGYFG